MTEPSKHNIDLDKLKELGHVGVRRAALFLGLGLNAAHREDFNDYQLSKLPRLPGHATVPMEFFPGDLPAERVKEFKAEFAVWVIACGMREIIEHYAQLLDQLYIHGLIVLKAKGKLAKDFAPETRIREFGRWGLPDKFKELSKRFGLKIEGSDSANELYVARNALTHDLGIVTGKRAPSGKLEVSWRGMDLIATGVVSGKTQPVADLVGQVTEEETRVDVRIVERRKQFAVGQPVRLTQNDLSEICSFFAMVLIVSAINEFGAFLKANGVSGAPP